MAVTRLSERIVAGLTPPAAGRADYWDDEMPGFGLRISENGRKTWQVMYRIEGRKRRLSLGTYPTLSLELARDAAFDALQEVARGRDPARNRATVTGGGFSFEALAQAYLERYAKRSKKSWKLDQQMIEADLIPAWGRRTADSVTRADIIALIEDVQQRGHPYAANRRLALIRKIYLWGIEAGLVETSPVINIRPPAKEAPRQRILTDNEIAALWQAWEQMGWPYGALFKIALLTGQRRGDVAALRLMDIGLADQVWSLRRDDGQRHEVPLPGAAVEVLASMPRSDSPYAFPAGPRGDRPVTGFSNAVRRAAEISGIEGWRIGDLRRTTAAGMARLGASAEILNRLLERRSQVPAGLDHMVHAGISNDDLRRALDGWAGHVLQLAESSRTLWHGTGAFAQRR